MPQILLDPTDARHAAPATERVYCSPRIDGEVRLQADVEGEGAFEAPVLRPIDLTDSHGVQITRQNLEQMAAAYNPSIEAAALNFDHAWGGPAHGWCARLWMAGEELWARFERLSADAIEGIRSGQWPRRSSEFYTRHPATGGWYFTGLALLGNSRPAVWGLGQAQLLSRPVLRIPLEGDPPMSDTTQHAETTPSGDGFEIAGEEAQLSLDAPPAAEPTEEPAPEAAADDPEAVEEPESAAAPETELEARVRELELRAVRAESRNEVRTFLDSLGSRLTPALRRVAEPLLVELETSGGAGRVELAGEAEAVPFAAALRRLLAGLPKFTAIDGPREIATAATADETPDPRTDEVRHLHRKLGLTQERVAELQAKYHLKVN